MNKVYDSFDTTADYNEDGETPVLANDDYLDEEAKLEAFLYLGKPSDTLIPDESEPYVEVDTSAVSTFESLVQSMGTYSFDIPIQLGSRLSCSVVDIVLHRRSPYILEVFYNWNNDSREDVRNYPAWLEQLKNKFIGLGFNLSDAKIGYYGNSARNDGSVYLQVDYDFASQFKDKYPHNVY